MFISINQTKAKKTNEFEIIIDGILKYYANTPDSRKDTPFSLKDVREIKFMNTCGDIIYTTDYNLLENVLESIIPFKYVFTGEQKFTQISIWDKNNKNCGSICSKMNGMLDSKYCITFNNEIFLGYDISIGRIRIISIYKDELEIAQITKPIDNENLDTYYIHLLDDYSYIADVISFFAIYFDYLQYGNGTENHYFLAEYSYSDNDNYYNKSWIREQFGEEEYNRFSSLFENKHNIRIPRFVIPPIVVFVFITIGFLLVFIVAICAFLNSYKT